MRCYGCGGMPIANVGVPVCVACSYISGCKLFHFDDNGRIHCDDPPGWHDLKAIKRRLQEKNLCA
jgi:hypothetical protein